MRSKRHASVQWVAAVIVCACTIGEARAQQPAPSPPAAAPASLSDSLKGMAKAEYEAGKILYGDGDYANARVKFLRAHELAGDPRLLWNIAACEKNLRRYAKVMIIIERYQREGGANLTDQDREEAAALIKAVRPFVSDLKVIVSEAGADVLIDDEKVGTSPLKAATLVDVGKRTIVVKKAGFKDHVKVVDVAGGTEMEVVAKLVKDVHRGRVAVEAGPNDLIAIDGKMVGRGRWEGELPSGGHSLRVTSPGMATHQSEMLVQDDKSRRIPITLNPLPKSDAATWLWVAGGAALVAGAIIGGAVLFQPSEAPQTQGTLGTFPLSFGGRR
jgi:PEGA domain